MKMNQLPINNPQIIIHVDMDAFYAAVEVRDNPDLLGRPLIIGSLPGERGVVSTCSYEARKFGVRSAMSIAEAYRRCPSGIYMRPNFQKYKEASEQIHKIWSDYTDVCEYISLDEGFLDVTSSAHLFGGARAVGYEIKSRTKVEVGLTCSVGIGYSLMSAKLSSEEKKPDGFFEIPNAESLKNLIIDRNVRIVYGIGAKTAEELGRIGVFTVRDIYNNRARVIDLLGNHGKQIIDLADGIHSRKVTPYSEPKSIGNEHTFQHDTIDFDYLKDVLLLIARKLSYDIQMKNLYCQTVTLKITYANMKSITRSKSGDGTNKAKDIYEVVSLLLDKIDKQPIRLVGIMLSNFSETPATQISLFDIGENKNKDKLNDTILKIQQKFGKGILKTANELRAEKRIENSD